MIHRVPGSSFVGFRVDPHELVAARDPDAARTRCDEENRLRRELVELAEVDRCLGGVLARVDPRQCLAIASGDPDRAEADRDVGDVGSEADRGDVLAFRVDPHERLLVGVRDPDGTFPDRDCDRVPADRHIGLNPAGFRVDGGDGVRHDGDGVAAAGERENERSERPCEQHGANHDRHQGAARPARRSGRRFGLPGTSGRGKRRVVLEDCLLELPQLRAGLQAKLVGEELPAAAIRVERVGLTS